MKRHWPTVPAEILEITTDDAFPASRVCIPTFFLVLKPSLKSVKYRYKVIYGGTMKTVERTQRTWNYPILDRINDTVVSYKEGEMCGQVHFHPSNAALTILKPGRFAMWNLSTKEHRLNGTLIDETSVRKLTPQQKQGALILDRKATR
mgnify:CR=1 FL=1